jgi:hypothetical protein
MHHQNPQSSRGKGIEAKESGPSISLPPFPCQTRSRRSPVSR